MNHRFFLKTVEHDLLYGIKNNFVKILFIIFLFISLSILFFTQIPNLMNAGLVNENASITDCWIFYFRGMSIYTPSINNPFKIPIIWLMIHALIGYVIFIYPTQDLHTHGIQILLRTKNRFMWWISKCIWNVCIILLCYIIAFLSACIFALMFGQFSFEPTLSVNNIINEMDLTNIISEQLFISIFLLPILTSITLGLFQMFLSFFLSPIISYIVIMCYLIASAYYYSPFLIGNFSMIIRNSLLDPRCSSNLTGIYIDGILILFIILLGAFLFKKYDILKKS